MTSASADEPFLLTVVDVFDISGRGTAVVEPIESGVVRTDERVTVARGDEAIATAEAIVKMINSSPRSPVYRSRAPRT